MPWCELQQVQLRVAGTEKKSGWQQVWPSRGRLAGAIWLQKGPGAPAALLRGANWILESGHLCMPQPSNCIRMQLRYALICSARGFRVESSCKLHSTLCSNLQRQRYWMLQRGCMVARQLDMLSLKRHVLQILRPRVQTCCEGMCPQPGVIQASLMSHPEGMSVVHLSSLLCTACNVDVTGG